MIGTRSNAYASCKLGPPKALPDDIRGVVELRSLVTRRDKRGKGFAGALLAEVCEEADKARRFLLLHVKPEDDTDLDRLAAFYAHNGFFPIQAEPIVMLRPFAGAYG